MNRARIVVALAAVFLLGLLIANAGPAPSALQIAVPSQCKEIAANMPCTWNGKPGAWSVNAESGGCSCGGAMPRSADDRRWKPLNEAQAANVDFAVVRANAAHAASTAQQGFATAAQITTLNAATPNTRTITTTAPLTGGGDLSANRTFAISPATTAAAGSFAAADFTKLAALQTTNNSWAGNKITSLGDGTADQDAVTFRELANPFRVFQIAYDFDAPLTSSTTPFQISISGAGSSGASTATGQDGSHPGVGFCTTGTTNTGRCGVLHHAGAALPTLQFTTTGQTDFDWLVRLEALSTAGVQQYVAEVGLLTGLTEPAADGVYFRYDVAVDPHWQVCTANTSVRTCTATTATVTATQWDRLSARKADGTANWTFSINGVSTGITNSTNLPAVALTPRANIVSSVGTTSKSLLFDAFRLRTSYNPERGN